MRTPGRRPRTWTSYASSAVSIRAPVRTPGRLHSPQVACEVQRFNPRPGANTGATPACPRTSARFVVSIRAPVRTPGRRSQQMPLECGIEVSIRAPVRTPGRRAGNRSGRRPTMFQSAPRCEHRGDSLERLLRSVMSGFNPRPGANTGATHRGPGRPRCARQFQSAPRCEHRGDNCAPCAITKRIGFNPRPGANTGATPHSVFKNTLTVVSIRAPVRTPGRPLIPGTRCRAGCVSIRAPVRTPGRLVSRCRLSAASKFQSAPRCEHRGDRMIDADDGSLGCFNPRPGANTGATQHKIGDPGRVQFQSAPRCEHRGDTTQDR